MSARRLTVLLSTLLALLGMAVVAPPAGAEQGNDRGDRGGDSKRVRVLDDCDSATFNALFQQPGQPPVCVKNGDTTAQEFLAEFAATRAVDGWKFKPDDFHIDVGDNLSVVNKGGEFHTFSEVANFGPGCFTGLNQPGETPVPECNALAADGVTPLVFVTTGLGSGGSLHVHGLNPGTHMFECLIHPWMRSVVEVRADDHGGHDHGGHDH